LADTPRQLKDTDWSGVSHRYSRLADGRGDTVFPFILELIANLCSKRILDFGAGDGRFALMCAESGLDQIVAYEPAEEMCRLARENCLGSSRIRVVQEVTSLKDGTFRLAVMNAVWMSLDSEEECITALSEVNRLLCHEGTLIASVTHPCFRDHHFETLAADFNVFQYWSNGSKFEVSLGDGHPSLKIVDTHWNLTAMTSQLSRTGFVVAEMTELPDTSNCVSPPAWLIIRASKVRPCAKG
jgi:SAM-dependent methyltransferase